MPEIQPVRVTGSCLCGRVQYAMTGPFPRFRYCHCERCRKSTGAAHSSNLGVPKERFAWIAGESEVATFEHRQAENYRRCFCRYCGGPVPKLARDGVHMLAPAGALDADPGVRPDKNIYWRLRAPWFVPTSGLPNFEESAPANP